MLTLDEIKTLLKLEPHPKEGGFFAETYRSPSDIGTQNGPRSLHTAIYYLLTPDSFSEMHVLPGDEMFHFYLGSPVRMLQLWPDGTGKELILGSDIAAGQVPQLVVPAGVWQAAVPTGTRYALCGCTVAPGFEYVDFDLPTRQALIARFPSQRALIEKLTRA